MKPLLAFLLLCCPAFAQLGASLVPPSSATDTAAKSGSWQDVATWTDGTVPVAGERVFIPAGVTVTNHGTTADVLWIHVAGTLTCCDHCDTRINVHTLFVTMGGSLDLGYAGMPCTGQTVVEFLPGAFLPDDWQKVSRGLICHGACTAHGNEKLTWCEVAADIPANSTTVTLAEVPYGWQVGDTIVVMGTGQNYPQPGPQHTTEYRLITAINGRVVTVDRPFANKHVRQEADLPFHAANMTRNVVFRSRNVSTLDQRGHLMFMSAENDFRFVAMEGLGRTDASRDVTDPRVDAYGVLIPGSDSNPRARYSDHFHRVGPYTSPIMRVGCVARAVPNMGLPTEPQCQRGVKWGFLNHKSNVHYIDCIADGYYGAGFGSEEGQERGRMVHCLSMMNDSNKGLGSEFPNADLSRNGSGFWIESGLIETTDSVGCDNSGHAFVLYDRTFNMWPKVSAMPDYLRFPVIDERSVLTEEYPGTGSVEASAVVTRKFSRNTGYHNGQGIFVAGQADVINRPATAAHVIRDITLWGRGARLDLEYAGLVDIVGFRWSSPVDYSTYLAALSMGNSQTGKGQVVKGIRRTGDISKWRVQYVNTNDATKATQVIEYAQ